MLTLTEEVFDLLFQRASFHLKFSFRIFYVMVILTLPYFKFLYLYIVYIWWGNLLCFLRFNFYFCVNSWFRKKKLHRLKFSDVFTNSVIFYLQNSVFRGIWKYQLRQLSFKKGCKILWKFTTLWCNHNNGSTYLYSSCATRFCSRTTSLLNLH